MAGGRWFIALPVDAPLLAHVPPPPEGVRPVDADDLHVTLAYLGHCGETAAFEAFSELEPLRRSLNRAPTFALGRIEPLGPRGAYTALGAELIDDAGWTASMIARWRDPLIARAGGRLDPRPPRPHVTLARPARHATQEERSRGLAWASALDLGAARGAFHQLALYAAVSGLPNRRYGIVASIPLVR